MIFSPESSLHIAALENPKLLNNIDQSALSSLAAMEKAYIIKVLEAVQWQISGENAAAAILEMHPNTLRSRMNKLGIRRAARAE